jgi:hypothetical protein
MDSIILSVEIEENRRLVIDLPPNTPVGQAELIIKPHGEQSAQPSNPAREAARAKLLAVGALSTTHRAPEGTTELTLEESQRIWSQFSGGPSLDDLINEDRGEY